MYVAAAILACGIAVVAGTMYWLNTRTDTQQPAVTATTTVTATAVVAAADTIHYESEGYGFALDYPRGLVVKEFDEGRGSYTVVFQKPDEYLGFQVYITQNVGNTITGATIQRDVPSGVVNDLKEEDLIINGGRTKVRAATFWSESPLAGKTREIWMLHNGFIFEFTAYAGADDLLRGVLQTLVFTK